MSIETFINENEENIIKDTVNIIKIQSTEDKSSEKFPFGEKVNESLDYALDLCKKLGFKTKNLNNMAGYAEIGEGKDLIGILVHLDVVPAGDIKNWTFPPFEGKIHENKIYGRGAIDDKGPAIASIYAMKALLENYKDLNKRVRIIFGLNEETSWKSINYYIKNEEIPSIAFTPDADFPVIHGEKGILTFNLEAAFKPSLNDGGIEILEIKGGSRTNMVADYAEAKIKSNKPFKNILDGYLKDNKKANITFEEKNNYIIVKSNGNSAHGSTPELGVNAISHLLNFLSYLDLQVGDSTNFLRFFKNHIGTDVNGENIRCDIEDKESGKLTFNVGTITLNQKEASIGINIRYPVTSSEKEIYSIINSVLEESIYNADKIININPIKHKKPIYIEKNNPFINKLMSVYRKYTDDSSEPITIGGGTYARSMDNCVAFGPLMPNRKDTAHQANEHIYIDDLILSSKIYAESLKEIIDSNN